MALKGLYRPLQAVYALSLTYPTVQPNEAVQGLVDWMAAIGKLLTM